MVVFFFCGSALFMVRAVDGGRLMSVERVEVLGWVGGLAERNSVGLVAGRGCWCATRQLVACLRMDLVEGVWSVLSKSEWEL